MDENSNEQGDFQDDDFSEKRRSVSCRLNSVKETKEWLRDPTHHIKTALYVIKWEGLAPFLAVAPFDRRVELEQDDSLAEVVYIEHVRRRQRASGATIETRENE